MRVHPDFSDFIAALNKNKVEFVIVGSFALAYLGYPRATGDIDLWIRPTDANAQALLQAIRDFGFQSLNLTQQDVLSGKIIQLGVPPVRIDLLTVIDGLNSESIWSSRESGRFADQAIFYLGKDAFIRNKRATGRHKDLADLEALGEQEEKR